MKIIINLEKGRPSLPEGSRRQHTQMRNGVPTKVWVKKVGGKWVYDGMVEPIHKKTNVGKRSRVRAEALKKSLAKDKKTELIFHWAFEKVPSAEFIQQEQLKVIKLNYGETMPASMSLYLSEKTDGEVSSWEDIQRVGFLGYDGDKELRSKLHKALMSYPKKVSGKYAITAAAESLYWDASAQTVLTSQKFDGKLVLKGMSNESTAHGFTVSLQTNVGMLYHVPVGWSDMEAFFDAYVPRHQVKMLMNTYKKSDGYKKWQVENDPRIKSAVDKLKEATGLNIETTSISSRGNTMLSKAYITKIAKAFNTLKAGFDMTKYTPPDGKLLKIRITGKGAVSGAAGFYTEQDQSINIAPSMPGTISHEVGHYFWARHPKMQEEFNQWVKDSGLMAKIEKHTRGKIPKEDRILHINHQMNERMKFLLQTFTDTKSDGSTGTSTMLSKSARLGLSTFSNILRFSLIEKKFDSSNKLMTNPISTLLSMSDGDILGMATSAHALGNFPGQSDQEMASQITAFRNGVRQLSDSSRALISGEFASALKYGNQGMFVVDSRFKQQPKYWEDPTEIFARTFRNYVAMKDGQTLHSSAKAQNRSMTVKQQAQNPHGWDFPEISPQDDMLKFDNNRLERILKKHIGGEVMKAIQLVFSKSYDDDDDEDEDKEYEKEVKNDEARDANDEAHLIKSVFILRKAKYESKKIGSNGKMIYKYATDHKTSQSALPKDEAIMDRAARRNLGDLSAPVRKTFELFLNRRAKEGPITMKPPKRILDTLVFYAKKDPNVDVQETDTNVHIRSRAGSVTIKYPSTGGKSPFMSYTSSTQRVGETLTADELKEYEEAGVSKSRSYPEGTIRKHGGRTMIKKDGGWVPASEGDVRVNTEDKKNSRNKISPKNVITGSPAMLTALVNVGGGKAPFLDDLSGKQRKLYNSMTKAGLIKWVHVAEEEYRPELTESGQKAMAGGQALKKKSDRAKRSKK